MEIRINANTVDCFKRLFNTVKSYYFRLAIDLWTIEITVLLI